VEVQPVRADRGEQRRGYLERQAVGRMTTRVLHQRQDCNPDSIWCLSNCPRVVAPNAAELQSILSKARMDTLTYQGFTAQIILTGHTHNTTKDTK
jgi:hypothetical protein